MLEVLHHRERDSCAGRQDAGETHHREHVATLGAWKNCASGTASPHDTRKPAKPSITERVFTWRASA